MSSGPIEFSLTLPRYQDLGERDPYRRTYEFAHHVESIGYAGRLRRPPLLHARDQGPVGPVRAAVGDRGPHRAPAARHRSVPRRAAPPGEHLEQVSTLDQISNGRAVLGLGTGYRPYEFKAYGSPFGQRGRRLSETIEVLRNAWTTGSYRFDGEFFQFDDLEVYPPCVQRPHPPIYVGGTSEAAIQRAARLGDTWFTLPMETLPYVQNLADRYRARARDLPHDTPDLPDARGVGRDHRRSRRAGVVRPRPVVPPVLLGGRHVGRPRGPVPPACR